MNFMSCLFEQKSGYGRVDASREAYENFHKGLFEIANGIEAYRFESVIGGRVRCGKIFPIEPLPLGTLFRLHGYW